MKSDFGVLKAPRRTGDEAFHREQEPLGFTLHDFWAWSVSDLVSNATRGRLAEYIVARALGISTTGVRDEWAAYDLLTEGGLKVEVKSAAYLQSWFQHRPSVISFSTRKSLAWNAETNLLDAVAKRQSDVYVFALLAHMEKASLDPLNVTQWQFYVLPTRVLDARTRSQHSITLNSLNRITSPTTYDTLRAAVEATRAQERES